MIQRGTWLDRPRDVEAFASTLAHPTFAEAAPHLQGIGKGKVVLHHRIVERVMGRPLDPGGQQTGDCAGWTGAGAADVCACVDALLHQRQKERYSWNLRASVEWTYALAREYGDFLGTEQGASIAWVAQALLRGGTISRQLVGKVYSGPRSDTWGKTGVPNSWKPAARAHRVNGVARVRTPDEVRDSVCSWKPVCVGFQGIGFNGKRDRHGFCRPKGDWNHAILIIGYRDDGIEAFLVKNHSGDEEHAREPQGKYPIPGSCFWIRPDVMAKMLQCGDSWSVTGFMGYRALSDQEQSLLTG